MVSCSSPIQDTGPVSTFQQEGGGAGFGSETVIHTITTNATIVTLEPVTRKIVLKYPDGHTAPYKAGPEVSNFNLLKAGDEVKTTVADQVGVSIAKAGAQPGATHNVFLAKGAPGASGGSVIRAENITGNVVQIDPLHHALTLQLNNGQTRTIKLQDMINLADLQPGDQVTITITEARTFAVEKP
jgi:hypothetical protein